MNNLLKIVKETGISFSGALAGVVLNYVLLIIITRFLAPQDYGTFVLAQAIINVSLIFVLFGTPKALDRFIPFYNAAGEQGKTKTLIYGILKIVLLLCMVVGLGLFTISRFLSHFLFKNPNLIPILKVMVLSVPMLAIVQVVSYIFIGYKEVRYRVYIQQLTLPLLKIILGIAVFALGYSLLGWTWIYIFSLAGASSLALWFFRKHISSTLSQVAKKSISFSEIVSYSWPLSINSIILIFLGQIDFLFLGYFRTSSEVGVYSIYIYLVAILGLVLSSFAQIYKPVISESISRGRIQDVREIYRRVSKWIFIINAFGLLFFLLFGEHFVKILFTKTYLISPAALSIISVGIFLNSSFGPEGMTLEAFGNTKLSMLNSLVMLGTNVGLDYFLIPHYGIIGAAIATATSVTVGGLAGLIEIYILYRLQPYNIQYLRYIIVVLVTGVIAHTVTFSIVNLGIVTLFALISILTVIYIIGVHFSRSLDNTDYQVLSLIRARIANIMRIKCVKKSSL